MLAEILENIRMFRIIGISHGTWYLSLEMLKCGMSELLHQHIEARIC